VENAQERIFCRSFALAAEMEKESKRGEEFITVLTNSIHPGTACFNVRSA
jgi:hypothetical protein